MRPRDDCVGLVPTTVDLVRRGVRGTPRYGFCWSDRIESDCATVRVGLGPTGVKWSQVQILPPRLQILE